MAMRFTNHCTPAITSTLDGFKILGAPSITLDGREADRVPVDVGRSLSSFRGRRAVHIVIDLIIIDRRCLVALTALAGLCCGGYRHS